jgi:4,4'-diaponeurosporenoate glycosyltransferase
VLVFLDADTALEPGGLRAMVGALLAAPGPLSVCPWHAVEKPYEELSAFFNLAMAAGAGRFGLLGRRLGGGGLVGPSLLVRRADYERVGGHAAVRGQILEHFFLARQFAAGGITVRSAQGRGVLRVRMYPGGLRALAHGWGKAFAAGAAGTSPAALALTVAWLAGAVAAAAGLAFGGPEQASRVALYALYALQLALLLRALGGFRLMTAALYPVPLAFYFLVFAWSAGQRWTGAAVSWKGRRVTTGRAPDAV